ncbi:MAG: hypothetical protein FJY16_04825 [Bacteroidetes bacterium]|nr:hypothetical protein [Bacteroidota bacterium]
MKGVVNTKYLLFVLCCVTAVSSVGQDCAINRATDLFTRETRLSSGFIELSGAAVTIDADKKEVDILFAFKTNRCFDDGCTATIYFTGTKSKLLLRNAGTMNCEGLFHFIFRNAATVNYQLKKLATAKISHIVFTDRDQKIFPVNLEEPMQARFMQAVDCVSKEAVKLIQ